MSPEDSRRARVIRSIAEEQHITPQEAAQRLLEEAIDAKTQPSPAEQMWGAFSGDEDAAMLDEIVIEAYALRLANPSRDSGFNPCKKPFSIQVSPALLLNLPVSNYCGITNK